ncbi:MAG: hypothetical protein WD225_02500, partial [Ilumatobacteraceae bacterium]
MVTTSAASAPGELDPEFGDDGVVSGAPLDTYGPVTTDDQGRIYVLGAAPDDTPAVARFLPDGTPDTSFSGDGRADLPVDSVEGSAFDVRVVADGTVVAVGTALEDPEDPFSAFAYVARFTSSGSPAAFGTGGVATRDITGPLDDVRSGLVGPTGTVVVSVTLAGGSLSFESVGTDGAFEPFDPQTTSDAEPPGATGCMRQAFAPRPMVFVSDTRFLHAGGAFYACDGDTFEYPIVSVQQVGADSAVWSARLPDDETVDEQVGSKPAALVGGAVLATSSPDGAMLRRFDAATGAIDTSFGTDGAATLPGSFGDVGGVAGLAGGQIAVTAAGTASGDEPSSIRLRRLTADGASDPTFPAVSTSLGDTLRRADVAGAPDGGILVTAVTDSSSALRRYEGSPPPAPGELTPLQPGRLLDTRDPGGSTVDGEFAAIGARPADSELTLQVGGRGGVPDDASAVVLNVTVTGAQGAGFVTVWPCDQPRPATSSLNFVGGQTVPNAVVVKLSPSGTACLYNAQAATDLLADVNGYFPAGSGYEPLQPGRLLDSRDPGGATVDSQFAAIGTRPADTELTLQVGGRGGVPADA